MAPSQPAVWVITGCSTGFGAALTREVLSRGAKVIATARKITSLEPLKAAGADVLALDVTASLGDLQNAAKTAFDLYGRVDYLVNNAGYVAQGTIEELTPEETQKQFDTNVFGLLNVTRAFLPYFRKQRSGVIANVSSIGAWRGFAGCGTYTTSKWAVSGYSETMTQELADFGIKVVCVEPGYFRSNLLGTENRKAFESKIKDYDGTAARKTVELLDAANGKQPGDIAKGVKVMVDVLTGKHGELPIRLPLGKDAYSVIKGKCEETLRLLEEWKEVSTSTDHDDVAN